MQCGRAASATAGPRNVIDDGTQPVPRSPPPATWWATSRILRAARAAKPRRHRHQQRDISRDRYVCWMGDSGMAGSSSGLIDALGRPAASALARLVMALWAIASGALGNATHALLGLRSRRGTRPRPVFRAIVTRRSAVSESSELCDRESEFILPATTPEPMSPESWGYLRHRQSNCTHRWRRRRPYSATRCGRAATSYD